MLSLLLAVIYLAFISLGLPDAMLGAAWPTMYGELGVPVSWAGIIGFLIAGCTIVSSLLSDRVTRRFGAGLVTAVSVGMTAAALLGFSVSTRFWMLCLWALPYGLGAGSVDAALNNYVALHYQSRHMSWLHCFWGLGASLGPYIMGFCLAGGRRWSAGYVAVGCLQAALTGLLLCTLPQWKGRAAAQAGEDGPRQSMGALLKLKGVGAVLAAMLCYCAAESTLGLWASTYMVLGRGYGEAAASSRAALFYVGLTLGRFASGFLTERLGDKGMVRLGVLLALCGGALLLLPFGRWLVPVGLTLLGLGCAPVYPSLIHTTPQRFGAARSQAIIGMQMASAYTGSTLAPPVFGFLAARLGQGLYPVYALAFLVLLAYAAARLYKADSSGEQQT